MFLFAENTDNDEEKDIIAQEEGIIWSISECIFCNKKLNSKNEFKCSKLLQCLHAICYKCFSTWDDTIDKKCSICNFISKKQEVTENKVLAEMVCDEENASNKDIVCTIHDTPVSHWCDDCAEFICEDCVNQHGQLKSTQNHVIKSYEAYFKEKSGLHRSVFPCNIHPQNDLTIVCHTCRAMTCRDCQLETHKDHKYDFISDKVTNAKTELFDIYKKVEYSSVILNSALKRISEREEKLEKLKKTLVSDIKKEFEIIQDLIKKRCEGLMLTAVEKANKKLEDCEINKKSIQKNLIVLQHCLKFVKLVLFTSSDSVLFYTKDLILNHLKRISISQSIPSACDVINLKFSPVNIEDAKKKIENCGAIQEYEDYTSADKNYVVSVYSTLVSVFNSKDSGGLKSSKDESNVRRSASSDEAGKTSPTSSIVQQIESSVPEQQNVIKPNTDKEKRHGEVQEVLTPQQWHIPETVSIPKKSAMPLDDQLGSNIKKVKLQLPSGENLPSNSKSDSCSPSSLTDDSIESLDDIMTAIHEMESRENSSRSTGSTKLFLQQDYQNESWCSVCLKGGDVVCCNNCPKVFHPACHIPQISLPPEHIFPVKNIKWSCLLCQDIQPLHLYPSFFQDKHKKEMEIANRLLLELYCQVEASIPFRFRDNSTLSTKSICLADIKKNLEVGKYSDILSFVKDVRYMFASCFHYEQKDYLKISHARSLQEIFNRLLIQFCNKN